MRVSVINKSQNKLPAYETKMSAGMDVRADFSRVDPKNPIKVYGSSNFDFKTKILTINPGTRALIPTGIFTAIPEGHEIQIRPRSGLAIKKGLSLCNTPATIDADYRNEIGVAIINLGLEPVSIENGERIAQFILNKVETIEWEEVEKLDETERKGGWGHTGTK